MKKEVDATTVLSAAGPYWSPLNPQEFEGMNTLSPQPGSYGNARRVPRPPPKFQSLFRAPERLRLLHGNVRGKPIAPG